MKQERDIIYPLMFWWLWALAFAMLSVFFSPTGFPSISQVWFPFFFIIYLVQVLPKSYSDSPSGFQLLLIALLCFYYLLLTGIAFYQRLAHELEFLILGPGKFFTSLMGWTFIVRIVLWWSSWYLLWRVWKSWRIALGL